MSDLITEVADQFGRTWINQSQNTGLAIIEAYFGAVGIEVDLDFLHRRLRLLCIYWQVKDLLLRGHSHCCYKRVRSLFTSFITLIKVCSLRYCGHLVEDCWPPH